MLAVRAARIGCVGVWPFGNAFAVRRLATKSVNTDAGFVEALRESKNDPVVIKFGASWCKACTNIEPTLQTLDQKYPSVTFLKVDTDGAGGVTSKTGVKTLPTFLFLRDGTLRATVTSVNKTLEELSKEIGKHVEQLVQTK